MAEPIKFAPGREARLVEWLHTELLDAGTARLGLERQWRDWLSQYRPAAKQSIKSFPYEGAANYVLPMTATDTDVLYARFMQTIHAPENIWTVSPLNERWKDAAKPLQDFLQILDHRLLKMYRVDKRAFLEMVKLGTAIYKTGWHYESRPVWTYDALGARVKRQRIVSAPFVDHVRLADFLLPGYSYAIQPDEQGGAPWTAERLRIRVDRLRSMASASSPFLPNIDKAKLDFVLKFEESGRPAHDVKIQELDFVRRGGPSSPTKETGDDFDKDSERGSPGGATTHLPREIELWEIHARFATQGDSEDDIIVWYHQPTRTLLRSVYAFYHHGQRPYDPIRYFPGDGFYGIGLCEQKEVFQAMSSELFNFTYDNVLLANSRMIVARAGANISPGEPVYPYKVWLTDGDVRQDFGVFPMADIYSSLPVLQQHIQALGERRTGISDIQLGNMQQLPGRTPATTMLSLLQEGNRRPDLTIKDMRYEGLSIVGLRLIQLCQQFISSPVDLDGERWLQLTVDMLGMPEGAIVAEKLATPLEPAEFGVGVSLTATSGSANKEVERQGALSLLQLATQVAPQFIQLVQVAMQSAGTPLSDVALRSALGLQELYKRVLEQYDVRNIEEVLPLSDQIAAQGAAGTMPMQGGAPQGNGNGGLDLAALLGGQNAP
jgi:hypothetical protein